jgi:hypothetical protein
MPNPCREEIHDRSAAAVREPAHVTARLQTSAGDPSAACWLILGLRHPTSVAGSGRRSIGDTTDLQRGFLRGFSDPAQAASRRHRSRREQGALP